MPLSARTPSSRSLSGLCWLCRCSSGEASSGIAIEGLLERRFAQPPESGDERLVRAFTRLDVFVDQPLDGVRHFLRGKSVPQNAADSCVFRSVAADRDLVVLDALLLEPENADVAHVVVAARVDAARNLDLQV